MTPSPNQNPIVLAEEARKEFPAAHGAVHVLDGVDLSVDAGGSAAIMGPSGSGKSTLLQILGTLDRPTSGRILLSGENPFDLSKTDLARFRNQKLGFVFQDHHLLPQCDALENVLVPTLAAAGGGPDKKMVERARHLLERLGLADRARHLPSSLSGGERQRVAIARALINSPEILLCDEPTGSLDEKTAEGIGDCFLEAVERENIALIVATHNPGFAARFGQTLHLREGKLHEA